MANIDPTKIKVSFDTFVEPDSYVVNALSQAEPSCFNGIVRVVKYRVTIEQVDEPEDEIHARLQKLWDECKNHHHWGPLKAVASRYGLKLGR